MSIEFLNILKKLKEKCILFSDFSDEELKSFLHLSKVEKYEESGKIIFQQNDIGEFMYLILSGEVQVFFKSRLKGESIISTLGSGDIFGEISLITKEKRSANVKTSKQNVILLVVSEKILAVDYKIQLKIYKNLSLILAKRLKDKNMEVNFLKMQTS